MKDDENGDVELEDVIRPGTTRGLDFVVTDELRKRTGISPESVHNFALAEMLCNALDKDATKIIVDVKAEGSFYRLEVSDNGTKKLAPEDIRLILDFDNKASSKRGLLRVSRGYLGNALKCIFGYSYALAQSNGRDSPSIVIVSGGREYRIQLKPDRIKCIIGSEIAEAEVPDDGFTRFVVKFPCDDNDPGISALKDLIYATSMVNPGRRIEYSLFDTEEGALGRAEGAKEIRRDTSILWYEPKQFEALYEDFVRVAPETQIKEFIALFRGFTGKKVIREILQKAAFNNHVSDSNFSPTAPMKGLTGGDIYSLFEAMRSRAKPIANRSIPLVLGVVGEGAFEEIRKANGWVRLKYDAISGVKEYGEASFPFVIELAVFDRPEGDEGGLKVYHCVNFMASMEDIFGQIFDVSSHLARVGMTYDMPVTVVAHLVCPVLKWLNYGKSGLSDD